MRLAGWRPERSAVVAGGQLEATTVIHVEGEWARKECTEGEGWTEDTLVADPETGKMAGKEQERELKVGHSVIEF